MNLASLLIRAPGRLMASPVVRPYRHDALALFEGSELVAQLRLGTPLDTAVAAAEYNSDPADRAALAALLRLEARDGA